MLSSIRDLNDWTVKRLPSKNSQKPRLTRSNALGRQTRPHSTMTN